MNRRQAKRAVCAIAAQLIEGNLFFDDMSAEDDLRIRVAIDELYAELQQRSGLATIPNELDEIIADVLRVQP